VERSACNVTGEDKEGKKGKRGGGTVGRKGTEMKEEREWRLKIKEKRKLRTVIRRDL
jgi:hypothetical protein